MKNNPEHLRFLPPCDLCGGFRFHAVTIGEQSAHRCHNCRLVRLDALRGQCVLPIADQKRAAVIERSLRSHLKKINAKQSTILLIGPTAPQLASRLSSNNNLTIHLLTESETPAPRGVIRHVLSIEQAAFIPDLFDLVVADITAQPIPPSLLLQKARLWLKPEHALLLLADNSASLVATLWRRTWMAQRGASLTHLLTSHHLERYAGRSGFHLRWLRTVSLADSVAEVIAKGNRTNHATNAIAHLVAGVARLVSAGELVAAQLEKRGTAPIPLHKSLAERDQAPGLAHAMYVGVQREASVGGG
ncbi:MAG: hypothetical protein IT211_09010 [Armatimonadetes bacterium]|nr:hypothetical protein [Armatimonadota bacterium]